MNSLNERSFSVRSRMVKSLRTPPVIPMFVVQGALAVLAGLLLAYVLPGGQVSPNMLVTGLAGLAFCAVFLARPDLGVLIVLLVRSSTDLALQYGLHLTGGSGIMATLLSPNTALILILILAGGLYILSRRVRWLSLPGGMLLALMLVIGAVGMLRADNVLFSFKEWLPLVAVVIVYALSAHFFRTPERVQRVIDIIALSFILPAAYGFWQLAGHNQFILQGYLSRIIGTFIHPNPFSFYLVIIITLFTCQVLTTTGGRRLVSLVIVGAASVLLVGTLTRIAWGGAVIALLTIGIYRNRALLILVPLAVALVALVSPSSVARVGNPLGDTQQSGVEDRFDLWGSTYQFWVQATKTDDSSVATMMNRFGGLGPGAIDTVTTRYAGYSYSAHNDYIRVLNEYGIFGLLLYVLLIIVMLIFGSRTIRAAVRTPMASVPLTFFAVTLAFAAMSITDNVFGATQNQVYYWALAGMTAAIAQALYVKPARAGSKPLVGSTIRASSIAVPKAAGV